MFQRYLALALWFYAAAAWALPVSEMRVEGNNRIDDSIILNSTLVLPGDDYSAAAVSEAVKRVYSLGYFQEVSARADSSEYGMTVTITVAEKPTVARVEVLGNTKVKTQEIQDSVQVRPGAFLDQRAISRSRDWIRDRYMEKGYVNVSVRDTLIESGEQYAVRFIIDEGRKVRVKSVVVHGNQAVKDKAVIKAMKTKPRGWGTVLKVIPWFRKGAFNRDTLAIDLERAARLYQNHGYIEAGVTLDSVAYTASQDRVVIHLSVSEGARYRIGSLEFNGNQKFPSATLARVSQLKTGAVYRADDADKTLENLYSVYTEEGYIYSHIVPAQDLEDSTVNLSYGITENNQAYVNRVIIEGNTKTRDKVIRRQLKISPGQLFRRSSVIRSQREIFALGFFEDVQLNYLPADTLGDIDLIFEVKEKHVGQFQIGTTYGAIDGLAGFIQVGWPNVMGRGQAANVKTEFSKRKFNIELGFTEPWLFDTPTSAGFDLYHSSRNYANYDEQRTGGAVRLGRPVPYIDFTRAYWHYRLERINVFNLSALYAGYLKDQQWPKLSSSTGLTLVRDSRDRPFNASSGTRTVASTEFSGGILGGRVDYQKYLLEYRLYHPLFWKLVGMFRAKSGLVDGYGSSESVPVYEYFYVGGVGDDGIRGYPDRGVNRQGGRTMLVGNLEVKYSFNPSVYLLAFADAGNSWMSAGDFREGMKQDLEKLMYKGVGAGIRLEVPMLGILGLDWGYGLDRARAGLKGNAELHFQLGTTF
ncbi:MAG TPA: outer membrane protein assembly factor BamA [candidate division Zixibacteria bacterium]|nr:outer membrane protein assembly factor BamA [candidate division Zixibacteria bacterium]